MRAREGLKYLKPGLGELPLQSFTGNTPSFPEILQNSC
jgi:hypothetical protein